MGSSISMRSTAECRGSGRGVSPFHLSPGCIRGAGSVLVVGLVFVGWFGLHLGFLRHLPWANRASSSLNHRRLDDCQSLRARTA